MSEKKMHDPQKQLEGPGGQANVRKSRDAQEQRRNDSASYEIKHSKAQAQS